MIADLHDQPMERRRQFTMATEFEEGKRTKRGERGREDRKKEYLEEGQE